MGQVAYSPEKAFNGPVSNGRQPSLSLAVRQVKLDSCPANEAELGAPDGVVTVDILNGFCKVVGELGGNSAALIGEAGLPPTVGLVSGDKVSIRAVGELFEICARKLNCPDFGLRLAEMQVGCAVMKPLERLITHAPTLGTTFRCCIDHIAAYSSGLRLTMLPMPNRGMQRLRYEILLDDYYQFPQLIEQLAYLTNKTSQEMTGGRARVRAVAFAHTQIGSKWDYARRFSVPVSFDQDFDEVFFSEADLQSPIVEHDERIFSSEYERIAEQFPPTPLDTKARVAQAIRATLADSSCGREEVCAIIGVSSRTLHRQLARIGTNFERLRDEVRRNLCLRYLARSDLTITQVAGRLGFSEGSVLTHACQKWFAKSPRELRRHLLQ